LGFATTDEFQEWCKQFDHNPAPDDDDGVDEFGNWIFDDDSYLALGDESDIEDIERAIED
jgi:hypothetical protein